MHGPNPSCTFALTQGAGLTTQLRGVTNTTQHVQREWTLCVPDPTLLLGKHRIWGRELGMLQTYTAPNRNSPEWLLNEV